MTRWTTLSTPLDGDPWTALTDRRIVSFTRGEAPAGAVTNLVLAEYLRSALGCGEPTDRDRLASFAADGYCLACHCERETMRRFANGGDVLIPCMCQDDPIRTEFFGSVFDLRLVATALVRIPPSDVRMGTYAPDRLAIRTDSHVAVVMGMMPGAAVKRVWK